MKNSRSLVAGIVFGIGVLVFAAGCGSSAGEKTGSQTSHLGSGCSEEDGVTRGNLHALDSPCVGGGSSSGDGDGDGDGNGQGSSGSGSGSGGSAPPPPIPVLCTTCYSTYASQLAACGGPDEPPRLVAECQADAKSDFVVCLNWCA